MSDEEKAKFATRIINNDGTLEELIRRTDAAYYGELAAKGNGIADYTEGE